MKRFWISYICFAFALPFLFAFVHHDEGIIVVIYFGVLFTATGLLFGSLRLNLPVKLFALVLIACVVAGFLLPPTEAYVNASDRRTEFTIAFIVFAILMTTGWLVRTAATAGKYQFFLGFIAAVSTSAVFITAIFVRAVLPERVFSAHKEAKNPGIKPSENHGFDFNHPLGNTHPTTTNEHTMTTNALPVPDLKLQK